MKQIAFLLFILNFFTSLAQISKIEKSVSEKLPAFRKEYDDASFKYALSVTDYYQTFESRERYKRQIKFFQDINKLITEYKPSELEDVSLLNQAGEMLYASGMFSSAERVFRSALDVYRESNQLKTQQAAETLTDMALLYKAMGRYTLAEKYCDSARNLSQELFPAESSQLGISMNNLAVLQRDLGQYEAAEELISEAVRINEKALTKKSLAYALSLNNLAMLYQSMGKLKEAEPIMLEAIKTIGENLKEKSINYSALMTNLALLYQEMEKYSDAEIIFLKIIKIKENTVGTAHPDYAHMLHLITALYLHMGPDRKEQVEGLLKKTANIYKKALGEKDTEYASVVNDLGNYYRLTGNTKAALVTLQEALLIRKETLSAKNTDLISTLEYLGLTYWQMNKMPEAAKTLKEAADKTMEDIALSFPCISEAEVSKYWDVVDARLQRFYAFALTQSKSNLALSDEVYEYRINTKGFIINNFTKTKKLLLQEHDTDFIRSYYTWLDEKESLKRLYKLSNSKRAEENINLDTLEKKVQNHLKSLSARSPLFANTYNVKKITFKQIKDKLDPDEALVEVLHFKNPGNAAHDSVSYAALVVTKERVSGPEAILFVNGNELEKKSFNTYKGNLKQKLKDNNSYRQFWEKIEQAVNAKQKIYYSASGVFNEISIETMLLPSGQYLIDEKNIFHLGNSKDFLSYKLKSAEQAKGTSAALFGYPDFGPKGIVPRLPGTKVEVELLKDLLSSNGYTAALFLQTSATEQKVKTLINPAVLHIATHGNFIEDTPEKPEYIFGVVPNRSSNNPYLMSGLLMAGAEKSLSGDSENGILRVPEIARLALDKTEIVFLSACETLYGNSAQGDGFHALQKSFRVAGANSIILSLWKVNDSYAQEFVNAFYSEYIKTKDKNMSFLNARKSLREKYPEPFYWGTFRLFVE